MRDSRERSAAPMGSRLQRARQKVLCYHAFAWLGMHGVQGVECSNHSVPTIIETKKPPSGGFFVSDILPGPLIKCLPNFALE